MALDQASSLSRKLAYVPEPTFGFVKLLASSGSHCTKVSRWAALTSRVQVSARSRPPPSFIPTLIGLRAFDLVSSRVWWGAATNNGLSLFLLFGLVWFFFHLILYLFVSLFVPDCLCFVRLSLSLLFETTVACTNSFLLPWSYLLWTSSCIKH